jgi:hypothetical protein
MTNKTLIAKPVVKNQFWIVTDGKEKVGNVIADGSGFEVKLNGNKTHYKNTNIIKKITNIEFESNKKVDKSTPKSKCYHAAGWYVINQGNDPVVTFCPKYIFIQRYPYQGPFKSEEDAKKMINSV